MTRETFFDPNAKVTMDDDEDIVNIEAGNGHGLFVDKCGSKASLKSSRVDSNDSGQCEKLSNRVDRSLMRKFKRKNPTDIN